MANRPSTVKGIIPAAGYGKRLMPVTLATAKELMPVGRKPIIQHAIEEAIDSGLKELAVIIRKDKESIRDFIIKAQQSDSVSLKAFKQKLSTVKISYIYQKTPKGLGNAIYESRSFIQDAPFVMIIPDLIVSSSDPATLQLLKQAQIDSKAIWSSLVHVPLHELNYFSGAREMALEKIDENIWEVKKLKEQSGYSGDQNDMAFGRTYFPAGVIDYFDDRYFNPETGEVDLLFTFHALLKERKNYATRITGKAMDFGTWPAYEYFSGQLTGFGQYFTFNLA